MSDENDFYESLKEFHGPEKFSDLRRISLFGKNIDLYKFYECAKNKGGPTDAVIMTQWRDICLDIGLIHPSDSLSVKDAHKASKFFCDCFNGFKYPNPDLPNITRYGRKTKRTSFHNYCELSYRNADNFKGRRANISEDNLLWMAKNVMCRPKYKFYSNKISDPFSVEVSTFDDQWILPSYDSSVCLPYKIQSKVACAAKLATEIMRSPTDFFPWETQKRDALYDENSESPDHTPKNSLKHEMIKNVIHEVSKFLMTGHDLEICLTIILKALMVISLPQIPGLCKYLAQINLQLSEELKKTHDLKKQKEIMHIMDILCNILTLVVRDFFLKFSKNTHRLPSVYHQVILCIDSIRRTSCILLSKIDDSYKKVLYKYNCFTIDTRNIYDDLEGSYDNLQQNMSWPPGRKLYDKIKCRNHLIEDEDSEKRRKENYKINHIEILSNFILLIKYLTKTSTDHWQFLLICIYIGPFIKFLLKMLMGRKIPDYWFWDDLQDCLRIFFSSVAELSKKMGNKIQIGTVVNVYILCVILMHEKKISKTIFRKMVQILYNLHRQFDFHKLEFMRYSIVKACKILVYTLISMSSMYGINIKAKVMAESTDYYNFGSRENLDYLEYPLDQEFQIPQKENKDNDMENEYGHDQEDYDMNFEMKNNEERPLYCEEMIETFDESYRKRKELKNDPINLLINPDNPMCNPWSALPWDRPSIPMNKKKKIKANDIQNKIQKQDEEKNKDNKENENTGLKENNTNNKEHYENNEDYLEKEDREYTEDDDDDIDYDINEKNTKRKKKKRNKNKNKKISRKEEINNNNKNNINNTENNIEMNDTNLNLSRYSIDTNSTSYHDVEEEFEKEGTCSESEYSEMFEETEDEEEDEEDELSVATSTCSSDSSEDSFYDIDSGENKDNDIENDISRTDTTIEDKNKGDKIKKDKRKNKDKKNKNKKEKAKKRKEREEKEREEREKNNMNPFYSDTVHISEKFTMEEAVEYLQRFYKVVFRINEKTLQNGRYDCIDTNTYETPNNYYQSLYEEFNYRTPTIDLESERENNSNYIWNNNQPLIDPRNIRVKVEQDNDDMNNNNNKEKNKDNNKNSFNNNTGSINNENNNSNNYDQDTQYYDDDQDRTEFSYFQTPLIDYDFLNYAKLSKTTKEIICLCLVEMAEFDFCLDIIRSRYHEILECAYSDESAKPLWPIIHKLQMESSTIDTENDLNYNNTETIMTENII